MASFITLNTGAKIPLLGFGTWQSNPGLVGEAVISSIKTGYRHIDCAHIYGNEKEIGLALKKVFEEGIVKREDLFITSKLWSDSHEPEEVELAIDETLKDLQLDYVDLYLIHWPFSIKKGERLNADNFSRFDAPKTWGAMEKVHDSGKAHAIGVSNFTVKKLQNLLSVARVTPAVNQVECHALFQQEKLRSFCRANGIHVSAYSPLGTPGTNGVQASVLTNPVILEIAERLEKTPAQVALRWGLQVHNSVLPKSTKEARIKENFNVLDWSIPDDLFSKFSHIQQVRLLKGQLFVSPNGAFKSVEELWDDEEA